MARTKKLDPPEVLNTPASGQLALISEIIAATQKTISATLGTLRGPLAVHEEVSGVIPSGSIGLDLAIGIGGWPRGRICEVYGMESSGKTTLTLHAIANVQKAGGVAAFIDVEHAIDLAYAERLGVRPEELIFVQPDSGEDALNAALALVQSGKVSIIVIDSVAALIPRSELEGDMGDASVGAQARLMSQAMRKLTSAVHKTNTTVIFINQIRMKIGVTHGSPKTTTGGHALKFYASLRIEATSIGKLQQNDIPYGNRTKLQITKNKMAPPFKTVELDMIWGKGLSFDGELVDVGAERGIIQKSGSWYSYKELRLGQGQLQAVKYLAEHPELAKEIEDQIRSSVAA